jgi:hypothetical protein
MYLHWAVSVIGLVAVANNEGLNYYYYYYYYLGIKVVFCLFLSFCYSLLNVDVYIMF